MVRRRWWRGWRGNREDMGRLPVPLREAYELAGFVAAARTDPRGCRLRVVHRRAVAEGFDAAADGDRGPGGAGAGVLDSALPGRVARGRYAIRSIRRVRQRLAHRHRPDRRVRAVR